MKDIETIKNEISNRRLNLKQVRLEILGYLFLQVISSEIFMVCLTMVPSIFFHWLFFGFSVKYMKIAILSLGVHFLYYEFYLKKRYKEDFEADTIEIAQTVEALRAEKANLLARMKIKNKS
jgi:hypothetical protein